MVVFLISLILFVCLLLVLVILAQDSKGGGLTGNVGGASQIIGTRRTTDWVEKTTWGLAILLFVLTLGASSLLEKDGAGGFVSPSIERAKSEGGPSAVPQPSLDIPSNEDIIEELIEATEEDSSN
jgi:preprotein translocase subunit SecG